MAIEFDDDFGDDSAVAYQVDTPSGATLPVANQGEMDFYTRLRDSTLGAYEFTDPSDFADLDRILSSELMVWRMQRQLNTGLDQHGRPMSSMDQTRVTKSINETSAAISKAKDSLGLSRLARDKADEGESISVYLDNLRKRAHEFGIHRSEQTNLAIALLFEICSNFDTFRRSNDLERSKLGFSNLDDLMTWVCDDVYPRFIKVDEDFRNSSQRFWIGEI